MKIEYTCQERSVYAGKALWLFPTGAAIYDRRSYSLLCIDHAPEKPIITPTAKISGLGKKGKMRMYVTLIEMLTLGLLICGVITAVVAVVTLILQILSYLNGKKK